MMPFTAKVIHILKQIPDGKVMTYGQVARIAGSPRGARQVVRILHSMSSKHDLPWHRVINVKGQIALKKVADVVHQRELLENEGVQVNLEGFVDLAKYQYHLNLRSDEDG